MNIKKIAAGAASVMIAVSSFASTVFIGSANHALAYEEKIYSGISSDSYAASGYGKIDSKSEDKEKYDISFNSSGRTFTDSEIYKTVDIYFLNDGGKEYLTIPSDLLQEYQMDITGSDVLYGVYESDSDYITVDKSGLVKPKSMQTINIFGGTITDDYKPGTYYAYARTNGKNYIYRINLVEYTTYYATQKAKDYVDKYITSDMSTYDKIETICQFVASYDYSANYSSMVGMIVSGEGGDCWASTDTVNQMCEMAGLKARVRYGADDPGAGSGHLNSIIIDDENNIYIVEAGYVGSAPRSYDIELQSSSFAYKKLSDGTIEITEYLGINPDIVVPETIDGYTVTSIGNTAFYNSNRYMDDEITSVKLPDTLTAVKDCAFYGCDKLTSLYLPKNLSLVEKSAFGGCDNLNITIDPQNKNIIAKDGILFTYDMKTLLMAYNYKKSDYTVPDVVQYIEDQAFYDCSALKSIIFPEGLIDIGYRAFDNCYLSNCDVVIPKSVTGIGYGALSSSFKSVTILNPNCVINNTKENNLCDKEDGNTISAKVIFGEDVSTARTYAEKFNKKFYIIGQTPDFSDIYGSTLGDCNGDGKINSSDAVRILQAYASILVGDSFETSLVSVYDVNQDNNIDSKDAVVVLKYYAEMIVGNLNMSLSEYVSKR